MLGGRIIKMNTHAAAQVCVCIRASHHRCQLVLESKSHRSSQQEAVGWLADGSSLLLVLVGVIEGNSSTSSAMI